MSWDNPRQVFIDFETQSAADIREVGGRVYCKHSSTRILIASFCIDDTYHVWIPDYVKVNSSAWNVKQLWPYQIKPTREVQLHRGADFKSIEPLNDAIAEDRLFIAHNAYGFDRYIFERFHDARPEWADTLLLAKKSGRNGRLDALGKALLGQGKDHAKKLLKKLTIAKNGSVFGGVLYPTILPGDLLAFTRYAVGDVALITQLWDEFADTDVEQDVIEVNDIINNRGIAADKELLELIERLSNYSTSVAIKEIERLSHGKLHEGNIRSGMEVHEWLGTYGVTIVDDKGKPCLRKEVVQKFIDSPYVLEEYTTAATEIPFVVIQVMKLRLKALRITEGKVTRAKQRVQNGRVYDLFNYHQAHTGRFASHGLNIHNLPRPSEEMNKFTEALLHPEFEIPRIPPIDRQEQDIAKVFDRIKFFLPDGYTVDDASSALIRPSFMGDDLLCLVDYSQVEARCLAWLADERKMIEAFLMGRDLYKEFASVIFNVPVEKVTKEQRQIAKNAILGCGYGLAADKFRVYAAVNGADLIGAGVTAEDCINSYRNTYTRIAGWNPDKSKSYRVGGLWKDYDKAVKDTVAEGVPHYTGKTEFVMHGKELLFILPSGRKLHYPNARIEDVIPPYCYTLGLPLIPKATVVYDSPHGMKSLYGGLITENIDQAICRDMLCHSMVLMEQEGLETVLHVHDEIGVRCKVEHAQRTLRRMVEIMSCMPDWGKGFPVACEGFVSPRFVKSRFYGYDKMETKDLAI